MDGNALVVILLLVFGCAAFLFGIIYAVCQLFAWVGRGVWSILRPRGPACSYASPGLASRPRVCPNKRCRKVEYRRARYCSQCGLPLTKTPA